MGLRAGREGERKSAKGVHPARPRRTQKPRRRAPPRAPRAAGRAQSVTSKRLIASGIDPAQRAAARTGRCRSGSRREAGDAGKLRRIADRSRVSPWKAVSKATNGSSRNAPSAESRFPGYWVASRTTRTANGPRRRAGRPGAIRPTPEARGKGEPDQEWAQPGGPGGQAQPRGGRAPGEADRQDEGGVDRAGEEPLERRSRSDQRHAREGGVRERRR